MAGQTEADTGPVVDTGPGTGEQQADPPAAPQPVPDGAGGAHESGGAGHSEDETRTVDARLAQIEKSLRSMRKLFANHSHEPIEDTAPPAVSAAEKSNVVQSAAESGAVSPAIAEKPPTETASHVEEKQAARSGYFTRAHRIKVKARGHTR